MQEQIDRIVQFVKYADKLIITEASSPQKQLAFTQKLLKSLPRQIQYVEIDAYSHSPAALQQQISQKVGAQNGNNLSELAQRARTVFNHGQRLLVIVHQAQFWLDEPHDAALAELIQTFAQQASQSLIFVFNGEHGIAHRVEQHSKLGFIGAEIYQYTLDAPPEKTAAQSSQHDINIEPSSAAAPVSSNTLPHEDTPLWKNPTLIMVGGVSLLVIGVGMYSLISRLSGPSALSEPSTAAVEEETLEQRTQASVDLTDPSTETPGTEPEVASEPPATLAALDSPTAADTQPQPETPIETSLPIPPEEITAQEPAPTVDEAEPAASEAQPEAEPEVEAEAETAPEPEPEPEPTAEQPEPAAPEPTAPMTEDSRVAVTDNQWFNDQPRARAVIQLAAFGSEERARQFIREQAPEHGPVGEYRIYTQTINDRLLFTVTFGDFASTQRAEHAIDELPASIRSLEPYARSIGAVRDRISD